MRKLLKDPLLHFLLIGALLFLVFELIKSPTGIQENRIFITTGDIQSLQANFARTWQRPPTEDELSGLIEDKVRDEIAYRESVAMGLDQDDPVIRRRLRMKMELLVEDVAGLSQPTDEDLETYLAEHQESFRKRTLELSVFRRSRPDFRFSERFQRQQRQMGWWYRDSLSHRTGTWFVYRFGHC